MPFISAGGYLLEGKKVIKKYEADDGDIKPIRLMDGDATWAGANDEPAGAVNDNDSARGVGSSRRKLGERVRFATFQASVETTDTGSNITTHQIITKKIPVLKKASFGVAPFVVGHTFNGKAYQVFFDPGPTLPGIDVVWRCISLTPEANR